MNLSLSSEELYYSWRGVKPIGQSMLLVCIFVLGSPVNMICVDAHWYMLVDCKSVVFILVQNEEFEII